MTEYINTNNENYIKKYCPKNIRRKIHFLQTCSVCGILFEEEAAFRMHMLSHTGENPEIETIAKFPKLFPSLSEIRNIAKTSKINAENFSGRQDVGESSESYEENIEQYFECRHGSAKLCFLENFKKFSRNFLEIFKKFSRNFLEIFLGFFADPEIVYVTHASR